MLTTSDIIVTTISEPMVWENAELACIGGKSNIRSHDRRDKLYEDNLIGQMCQYAATTYLTGSAEAYQCQRRAANANPFIGDDGNDLPGIDIKGSLMRYSNNPLNYRLAVRPREVHQNWKYVLALAQLPDTVYLVGWTDTLPARTNNSGVFQGAYTIPAPSLRPIQSLREILSF